MHDLIERVDAVVWEADRSAGGAATTALLVDDDALVRLAVGKALAGLGYHVLSADSAAAALGFDAAIDVALLDAHLDRRRCSDLGRTLRTRHPELRIVVMTALPEVDGYEFAEALLAKPFGLDELRATLARVLNDR